VNNAEAAVCLEGAISLWQGAPFGGLCGGPIVGGFTTWLDEARLQCIEHLMSAYIAEGRNWEVVSQIYPPIHEYPLRETFYQLLMLALYRSGRKADALRVYQQARTVLVGEIGMEPCRPMRDLYQAILGEHESLQAQWPSVR